MGAGVGERTSAGWGAGRRKLSESTKMGSKPDLEDRLYGS